ncbi:MAG: hypothetical protein ABS87_05505 [Sphingomonas sp. SCN 67-18]|uniref:DUF6491 family protein n=1 Tax=uncultured Sphingomonas sp. TaxID=158754 RepID=UPI00086DFE9D|nr:DUF6491 family protein [Sphingomonas sp. SCN 67-18]ODU21564.1 MAG: hypothetical protein ABS87_05505 [Sphingomonas sp. SCN 67-18]
MRSLTVVAAGAALVALAGCTTAERPRHDAKDAAAANFDEGSQRFGDGAALAGKATSCIPLRNIRASHVRGDRVIDFEMNGKQTYRNVLPFDCPSLGFEERFAYKTSMSELCSTDLITVLQAPGLSRGASCQLGQFQPISGKAR